MLQCLRGTSQRPVLLGALAESAEDAALAAFDQLAQQTPGGNAQHGGLGRVGSEMGWLRVGWWSGG